MYIKKEVFNYFEGLYKNLDDETKKKFTDAILKMAEKKTQVDIKKIDVVGDEIFDRRGVALEEFITRTMVKKAYKETKGE